MVTREELLGALGNPFTNRVVDRFHHFAFVPRPVLERLAREALAEEWGRELFALEKYLAVHVAWSVEQEAFTRGEDQFYLTAGHLQTRYGTPLYLVFERNQQVNRQPFFLRAAGSYISAPELPTPPDIPTPVQIPVGAEVVMMHDHILEDQAGRAVSFATGLACTLITRLVGFWAAGCVLVWRGTEMPAAFIVGAGMILLLNDGARVVRFLGSSGVWTELGYAAGGLTAVALLLLR